MGATHQEKRRAPRARASFPIQFTPAKPAQGPAHGQPAAMRDISTIGLCCSLPGAVAEMTLVRVDLALPGARATHPVQGVVVRCERDRAAAGAYEVGVYFTEMAPEARAAIAAYVASQAVVETKRAVR
jgi:hypothetical protein